MKWWVIAGLVGLLVLSGWEAHTASRAETVRDSVLAVSAVLRQQNAQIAKQGEASQAQAERSAAKAESLGRRAAVLEAIVRHPPLPIPVPDTTIRDSLRYFKAVAEEGQLRLLAASQALDARSAEVQSLRAALDSQTAATARFRAAYDGERGRADSLASVLRKMPISCRKLLGVFPMPRVGPQVGVIGRQLDFGVTIPLGC